MEKFLKRWLAVILMGMFCLTAAGRAVYFSTATLPAVEETFESLRYVGSRKNKYWQLKTSEGGDYEIPRGSNFSEDEFRAQVQEGQKLTLYYTGESIPEFWNRKKVWAIESEGHVVHSLEKSINGQRKRAIRRGIVTAVLAAVSIVLGDPEEKKTAKGKRKSRR